MRGTADKAPGAHVEGLHDLKLEQLLHVEEERVLEKIDELPVPSESTTTAQHVSARAQCSAEAERRSLAATGGEQAVSGAPP